MKRRSSQRGNTLVEFGVSATLLFSLMFGIIDCARALYTSHFVVNAARDGTRYAVVHGNNSPSPATQATIQSYLSNVPLAINPNNMTVTATWNPDNHPGSKVTVSVQYNFKFIMPFMPSGTKVIQSSSQMVISQ